MNNDVFNEMLESRIFSNSKQYKENSENFQKSIYKSRKYMYY